MFDFVNERNEDVRSAMLELNRKSPSIHPFDLWLRARRIVHSADFVAVGEVCSRRFNSKRDSEE